MPMVIEKLLSKHHTYHKNNQLMLGNHEGKNPFDLALDKENLQLKTINHMIQYL